MRAGGDSARAGADSVRAGKGGQGRAGTGHFLCNGRVQRHLGASATQSLSHHSCAFGAAGDIAYTSKRVGLGAGDGADPGGRGADLVLCKHQTLPRRRGESHRVGGSEVGRVRLQQARRLGLQRRRNAFQRLGPASAHGGEQASDREVGGAWNGGVVQGGRSTRA